MRIYKEYSVSRKAIVASVVHAIVIQTVLILSIYNTPLYEIQEPLVVNDNTGFKVQLSVLSTVIIASMIFYLYTGIPGILVKECEECGETTGAGEVWCDNCGRIHGVGAVLLEAGWFVSGYTIITNIIMYPLLIYSAKMSWLEAYAPAIHIRSPYVALNYFLIAVAALLFLIVSTTAGWLFSTFWSSTTGGVGDGDVHR